tara:strand:- start:197 stop:724 length:528 start_codon:yes stop_codon:yes gene_type:complete
MINLDFFKKLRFNRCEIVLNESEAYYLYSKFHNLVLIKESRKGIFSKKNIKSILREFCKISETRYFGENDIDYISNYYSEMLKEEIGRGVASKSRGLESSINDQTDSEDIIYRYTGKYVDDAANTFKGSSTNTETAADSVAFLKKGNVEHDVEVDDPDAAHVFLKNVEVNVINKI